MIAMVDNNMAVYQHVADALRILLRVRECRLIADAIRIEYDDVGPVTLAK